MFLMARRLRRVDPGSQTISFGCFTATVVLLLILSCLFAFMRVHGILNARVMFSLCEDRIDPAVTCYMRDASGRHFHIDCFGTGGSIYKCLVKDDRASLLVPFYNPFSAAHFEVLSVEQE